MPVAAPLGLAFGSVYLYGGGYLNRAWGDRKLAMLRAAEALLVNGGVGRPFRIASGLQVEADWLAGLDPEDGEALRRFDFFGVRGIATPRGPGGPGFGGRDARDGR